MNQPPVTPHDLLAVIGELHVKLRLAEETIAAQQARITYLETPKKRSRKPKTAAEPAPPMREEQPCR